MPRKAFAQTSVLLMVLLVVMGIAGGAQAGGVCGGTYVVDPGDTLDKIASKCGTTISAIQAANPGISGTLYAGQTLTVPGRTYTYYATATNYYIPVSYSGTYTVQYGDTFSAIASRYKVSINNLWAANPQIGNINLLYVGQVIHIPATSGTVAVSSGTQAPTHLSYGTYPPDTPRGTVKLYNYAKTEVYISLQGTTQDGFSVINEYSVSGTVKANVPAGRYFYVAWVGGQKFTGSFNLGGGADRSIEFYGQKILVE